MCRVWPGEWGVAGGVRYGLVCEMCLDVWGVARCVSCAPVCKVWPGVWDVA